MRHRQDHEIGGRQQRVELVAAVQFGNARRLVAAPLIDADHPNAECSAKPSDLAADAADPDDERRRLGRMHDPGVLRQLLPFAVQLLRKVVLQTAREGEHKRHHMCADVIVVDLAEVGDLHRVRDQLG